MAKTVKVSKQIITEEWVWFLLSVPSYIKSKLYFVFGAACLDITVSKLVLKIIYY